MRARLHRSRWLGAGGALALLGLVTLRACPARAPEGNAASAASAAQVVLDAGVSAPIDLLAPFLEAARSDLARPYPADAKERYAEAARALRDTEEETDWESAQIVADALGRSSDPRAIPALAAWAGAKETANEHRIAALYVMRSEPRAEYLEAVLAILASEDLAAAITITDSGAYCEALEVGAKVSLHALALEVALAIPTPAARALLLRVAQDRAASAPNARTLAALGCEAGQKRIEDEAQAVASLRLMALSLLEDKALLRAIAKDPSEPPLVRRWAGRMARGKPAKPDARAARTVCGPPGEDPIPMPWLAPSPCP